MHWHIDRLSPFDWPYIRLAEYSLSMFELSASEMVMMIMMINNRDEDE